VLVLLYEGGFTEVERLYRGLQSVVEERGEGRILALEMGEEDLLAELESRGTLLGIVGGFVSERWVEHWAGRGLCLVNTSRLSHIHSVPSVVVDNHAVGRLVARELVERGFAYFAYAGLSGYLHTHERWEGYREVLEAAGKSVVCAPSGWLIQGAAVWQRWLNELEFPALVFASSDYMARRIIRIAVQSGLSVPGQVSVVGVGNLYRESLYARMGLSSVELPAFDLGIRAGRLVFERATRKVTEDIVLPPVRLHERESLLRPESFDLYVERCLELMAARIREPLSVDELAQRVGASRRLLELRFKKQLGVAPYRYYLNLRLKEACRLLEHTDRKILEVAGVCGFSSQHQFANVFRREHGCSPRQYRESLTRPDTSV